MQSFILCTGVLFLFSSGPSTFGQQSTSSPANAPQTQRSQQNGTPQSGSAEQPGTLPSAPAPHKPPPQPKRILGVMPNYRAVSAGTLPPPPKPAEAFKIATQNSFDYSALVFVGITSLIAEGENTHPTLGKGVPGFWGYSWRGFVDKTDGNYMVDWVFPTITHEDERYYAKGVGNPWKRSVYAATRILITPNYQGNNTFNASEIVGRGVSQAISLTYYPSSTQTLSGFSSKYAYALARDAATNVFRELWPDIAQHVRHRHEAGADQD